MERLVAIQIMYLENVSLTSLAEMAACLSWPVISDMAAYTPINCTIFLPFTLSHLKQNITQKGITIKNLYT